MSRWGLLWFSLLVGAAALRDVQSVAKSALSSLVGIALGQGRIASLDQPVVALMPEWASLNPDQRAAAITVRHTFMANGFGGQFIWVHPPLDLVIATTSTASPESNRRDHALQLIRARLFTAARQRAADKTP